MRYEDASGTFQASGPIANDDSDTLTAGARGPATGNLITGEGTQYGSAGADTAAGAQITAIAGKGGEDSSFAGGKLSVTGEFGQLSVDAQGNYTYLANTGAPENVRDRFVYTLADNQGNSDTAALIVEIGKTPVVIKADAQQIVPGPDGVVTLPPGVELSDIMVVGRNLVVNMPDGTQLIIIDGAVFVPQLVLGGVEVPSTNVAALLIGQEVQPAAGETPPSSGGNFAVPPPPLDPGVPLGDLIPPTEYNYIPPEPQEVFPEADDEEPEILIQPDGQPASVAAVDEVDERGLPTRNGGEPEGTGEGADGNASNDSDPSEATGGTIVINSPDGVDSVTIAGADGVPHEIVVGLEVDGLYGTLTITGIVGDDYTYSYVLHDNIDHSDGDPDQDDFSVVLTDEDGDTASATLTINILDDVPTAENDTDIIASGEFGPATGNVITDADPGDLDDSDEDDGADTVGADDAELTNVTGFGGTEAVEGGWVVQGQYGVLTINTDGSYSYVRNEGTPGGVTDVFTYTLTDGDTDTDTATLTITIENATPETGENPTALLDDDALEDGNPGTPEVGDDVDAANLTGFLAGSGGDGPLTFDLLLTGAPDGFSYVDGPDGAVHVMQGTTHVLTVTIDAATGEYEVSQVNPIDHEAGGLENNAPFTINYTVTDQDDDVAEGVLNIDVDDDTPVVTVELDREGAVTVDESGPTGASTIEFEGNEGDDGDVGGSGPIGRAVGSTAVVQASPLFGADGPAADAELTYALALGSADTDLTLTDGSAIQLQLIDGVVVGVVTEGDHEGDAAFAIAIDPESGIATVELYLSLDHPTNPDPNDSLPLGDNTVSVVVSATDGDNDTVESEPVDISGLFNFLDDGPTADGDPNPLGAVTVDESGPTSASTIEFEGDEGDDGDVDGSGPIGRAVGTASVVVDAAAAFGADGPLTDDLSYALALGSEDTDLTLTDGSAIQLELIDGVVVGKVTEGDHEGEAAFAIAIDPTSGIATVELYLSLDHPTNPNPNDSLPLGPNTVSVVVSATDGDGDSDDSDPIDISGLFNFLDDGPAATDDVDFIVGGVGPATGNVITGEELAGDDNTTDGTADDAGADGGAAVVGVAAGDTDEALIDDGTVGVEIDGQYGKLTLNADGSYSYLRDADAPGGVEDVFTYTLTDGDGDTVTATLTIGIEDNFPDLPDPDLVLLDDDVIPGADGNADGDGDDNPDAPDDNVVSGQLEGTGGDAPLTYNFTNDHTLPDGFSVDLINSDDDTLIIVQDQGGSDVPVLTIQLDQSDGSFTVTQNNPIVHPTQDNTVNDDTENNVDTFSIGVEVEDADGDVEEAHITIDVDDDTPVLTNVQGGASVTLDETAAGTPAGFPIEDTSDTAVITATKAFGADGPAAVGDTVYGLSLANGAVIGTTLASGLQTAIGNHPITLTLTSPTTITGTYSDGGTQTAFTITMESDGKLTVKQEVPLEHLDTGDHNDSLDLVNGLSNLINATITITDSDGDSVSASTPIGDQIIFLDDGPDANLSDAAVGAVTLDESPEGDDTPGGTSPFGEDSTTIDFSLNFVNELNVDYGADGPGSTAYKLQLTGEDVPSGLYALDNTDTVATVGDGYGQGAPIVLNQSGNIITGSVGDEEYFTIEIDPDSGVVTFTQLKNIWNPTAGSTAAALDDTAILNTATTNLIKVIQTVTDADGDTDTAEINVGQGVFKIQDDGPEVTTAAEDSNLDTATLTATGDFAFDIGTDVPGGNAGTYLAVALSGTVDDVAITVTQQPTFVGQVGDIATYEFTFTYDDDGDPNTAPAENGGTVAFNVNTGGYTVTLDEGFTSTEVVPVSDVLSRTPHNTSGQSESQPEIVVSELNTDPPIFVEFSAISGPSNNTFTSGGNTTFAEGELFGGPESWASISNTENGVASDTVQSVDILNLDFYSNNPRLPDHSVNPAAVKTTAEGLTLDLAKLGTGEDMVVLLKLVSASDPSDVTTRVVIIPYSEIYTEGETLPDGYTGTLGNDLGLVVIESNDFNGANEDYVISGAQMIMSTQNISGSGILLNGATGENGGSDVDNLVTFASSGTVDQDVIKIVDIGLIRTVETAQEVQLTFDVTVTDADGDTATDQFVINPDAQGLAATSLMAASDSSQEEQLQKSAANSNTLTLAAAIAAAGMAESAAASPPADDQSFQLESDASVTSQMVDMQLVDGGDEGGSSVSGLADTFKAETASGDSAGRGRSDEHRSDNSIDAGSNQQPSNDSSSHQAANDQGPAVSQAAATPVAPDVAMVSAEMLIAAGLTGGTAKHNNVEEILADALGQGGAPTVDGLLAQLPGGLGELAAVSNVASPAAGGVPGWDMAMHGGSGFATEMLVKLDAAMLQHHDAVQPVING